MGVPLKRSVIWSPLGRWFALPEGDRDISLHAGWPGGSLRIETAGTRLATRRCVIRLSAGSHQQHLANAIELADEDGDSTHALAAVPEASSRAAWAAVRLWRQALLWSIQGLRRR